MLPPDKIEPKTLGKVGPVHVEHQEQHLIVLDILAVDMHQVEVFLHHLPCFQRPNQAGAEPLPVLRDVQQVHL